MLSARTMTSAPGLKMLGFSTLLVLALAVNSDALAGPRPSVKTTILSADLKPVETPRAQELIQVESITTLRIRPGSGVSETIDAAGAVAAGVTAFCGPETTTLTHTDSAFQMGQYLLQVGFAEDEIMAAQYTLTADDFPLTLRQIDFLIAQGPTTVPTTTHYSVIVWDGRPGDGFGFFEVARFNSQEDLIPVTMSAGPAKAKQVQLLIDPQDTDQIFIENLSGTATFTIGVEIDAHNNPPPDPCDITVEQLIVMQTTNAFPVVDVSGVASPTGNWLKALNCPGGCPAGWNMFTGLGICTPSGDWVMQACYDSPVIITQGACCAVNLGCTETANIVCNDIPGSTFFEDQLCADVTCPDPTGGCCAFGTCLPDQTEANCAAAAPSTYLGDDTVCGDQCACCMPDGSCEFIFDGCCEAAGGTCQLGGVTCEQATCPQPTGACCFPAGCFDDLLQVNCEAGGTGTWMGPLTTCTPDPCVIAIESAVPPSGAIDGRHPSDTDGSSPDGWSSLTLNFNGDAAGLTAGDLTIDSGGATAPGIIAVTPNGSSAVIDLDTFIPLGEWTMITHLPSGTSTCLGYLPGDANNDLFSNSADILGVIDCINGVIAPPCELWQCDIDRSGACEAPDILRVIDLLNGAAIYQPWLGVQLPASPCGP